MIIFLSRQEVFFGAFKNQQQLDVSKRSPRMYFINLQSDAGVLENLKLIKEYIFFELKTYFSLTH
jgi:hypothetical protein